MIYDIKIDLENKDVKFDNHYNEHIYQEGVWNNEILNISTPEFNLSKTPLYVYAPYQGVSQTLNLKINSNLYDKCYGFINNKETVLTPAKLMLVNTDGYYAIIQKNTKIYIYSAARIDFLIENSVQQSAKLLCLCAPGKSYRYPLSGINLEKYLGSIIERTNIGQKLIEELEDDGISIDNAEYDISSNNLSLGIANSENHEDILKINHEIKNPDYDTHI